MKKALLFSVVACTILTSCNGQKEISTAFPSLAPESSPSSNIMATKAPPTKTPLVPTITPLPHYQNKQILFDYYVEGDHSVYDIFFDPSSLRSDSRLVIYDDGQMIVPGETYKQKVLSSDEIKRFLSKLEVLGFYSLESNQKHDLADKLYNYGNNYQKSFDGLEDCILVNADRSRNLCIYEPDMQYLIPKMKAILQYLDEYAPSGMTPYYPDRILLWVKAGRDPYNDNLPATAIPWDERFPSLEITASIIYVDGDPAKEIYMFFDNTNAGKVFTQNGKEYTVYINVVLPHEKLTNAYR